MWFDWSKCERRVGTYYFYIRDADSGSASSRSAPTSPIRPRKWCNGHEWAKNQAKRQRLLFRELANGFASCDQPGRLQAVCDRFGPAEVQAFLDRWMAVIPTPLTAADRAGGWWRELSMRQVEVSRTLVFDDPRWTRAFFESLVTDNVGVGRPQQVSMVFARPLRRPTKHPSQLHQFPGRSRARAAHVSHLCRFPHQRPVPATACT